MHVAIQTERLDLVGPLTFTNQSKTKVPVFILSSIQVFKHQVFLFAAFLMYANTENYQSVIFINTN